VVEIKKNNWKNTMDQEGEEAHGGTDPKKITPTKILYRTSSHFFGLAPPCASPPPPWPSIFKRYAFLVHHPVNLVDRQLLPHAMNGMAASH
jgi:hypothetical protein